VNRTEYERDGVPEVRVDIDSSDGVSKLLDHQVGVDFLLAREVLFGVEFSCLRAVKSTFP